MEQLFDRLYFTKKVYDSAGKKRLLIDLPVLCNLSYDMKRRLQVFMKIHLPVFTLGTAFQSKTRLSDSFKCNDSIPKDLWSHIIFKFLYSCCWKSLLWTNSETCFCLFFRKFGACNFDWKVQQKHYHIYNRWIYFTKRRWY